MCGWAGRRADHLGARSPRRARDLRSRAWHQPVGVTACAAPPCWVSHSPQPQQERRRSRGDCAPAGLRLRGAREGVPSGACSPPLSDNVSLQRAGFVKRDTFAEKAAYGWWPGWPKPTHFQRHGTAQGLALLPPALQVAAADTVAYSREQGPYFMFSSCARRSISIVPRRPRPRDQQDAGMRIAHPRARQGHSYIFCDSASTRVSVRVW